MMKRILACAIGIMTSLILSAQVKPVTGTWINLVWQDDRNNYMNPLEADNTDPALWELKVEELHEIGVGYLVLMQVADGGKSFLKKKLPHPFYWATELLVLSLVMKRRIEQHWQRNMRMKIPILSMRRKTAILMRLSSRNLLSNILLHPCKCL